MNLTHPLFVLGVMSLCLVAGGTTAREAREHETPANKDREITDIRTDEELRLYLNQVRQLIPANDCRQWNEEDARVVAVFGYRTHKELWIGKGHDESREFGVHGLQRAYDIEALTIGGSPLRGSIQIRLPTSEMDAERACFSRLQGLKVRGVVDEGTGVHQGDPWNLTIDEVSFAVLVRPPGILDEKMPTGEMQVTLMISEGLVAMALRKSVEHLWALPGSLALMALWAMGARILARRPLRFRALTGRLASMVFWTVAAGRRIMERIRARRPVRRNTASRATPPQPGAANES